MPLNGVKVVRVLRSRYNYLNQVSTTRGYNVKSTRIIVVLLVVYVGAFFYLKSSVENTIASLLEDEALDVSVEQVTLPYTAVIQSSYVVPVFVKKGSRSSSVNFTVSGYVWSRIGVGVGGLELLKLKVLAGKGILD